MEGITMKTINYKNKTYKLPFNVACNQSTACQLVEVENPFSGEKCFLPGFAVAVYDTIKGAEYMAETNPSLYKTVETGVSWFSKNFTDEYFVLLD